MRSSSSAGCEVASKFLTETQSAGSGTDWKKERLQKKLFSKVVDMLPQKGLMLKKGTFFFEPVFFILGVDTDSENYNDITQHAKHPDR